MMVSNNIRLSWESIKKTKWRNFMTMMGIIIGVASVITIVSIGEGVRSQVRRQVAELGTNLLVVRPVRVGADQADNNALATIDNFSNPALNPLSDEDLKAINKTPGVSATAPLALVNGVPTHEGQTIDGGLMLATTSEFSQIIRQDVEFGQFLSENDEGSEFVVIGKGVAEKLLKQNVPIGQSIEFRGEDYVIKGVLPEFKNDPFAVGIDLNNAVFMSYTTANSISEGNTPIFQIFVEPASDRDRPSVAASLDTTLLKTHANQRDFLVLDQEDTIANTDNIFVVLTGLVAAIAAVSLFVGGVGIMNVMLVSVTERTKEIGIRKAVGATNKQILMQFLTEAAIISMVGSVIGILIALLANLLLRIVTDLQPTISFQVVLLAVTFALVTGVVFGVIPAVKAARKDPIDALRYE